MPVSCERSLGQGILNWHSVFQVQGLTTETLNSLHFGLIKDMLMICKWPRSLIVLNLVNSDITINKMAKVSITFIS